MATIPILITIIMNETIVVELGDLCGGKVATLTRKWKSYVLMNPKFSKDLNLLPKASHLTKVQDWFKPMLSLDHHQQVKLTIDINRIAKRGVNSHKNSGLRRDLKPFLDSFHKEMI